MCAPPHTSSRGAVLAFLATAIRVVTCTNTISHTRHSKEARTTNFSLFFPLSPHITPPTIMTNSNPNPPTCTYIYSPSLNNIASFCRSIGSCETHLFIITKCFFFRLVLFFVFLSTS